MNYANRIPASEKKPEDFLPPPLQKIEKRIVTILVKRADGTEDRMTLILRPGDRAEVDGKTILEY